MNFMRELFEKDVKMRLRPSYFPFRSPRPEVDISCVSCGGVGLPCVQANRLGRK